MSHDNKMTDRREWHLDKSLSVGHILTTLMILGALSVQYAQFTARLAVLENQQTQVNQVISQVLDNQNRIDVRQDQELASLKREIRDNYREILQQLKTR